MAQSLGIPVLQHLPAEKAACFLFSVTSELFFCTSVNLNNSPFEGKEGSKSSVECPKSQRKNFRH